MILSSNFGTLPCSSRARWPCRGIPVAKSEMLWSHHKPSDRQTSGCEECGKKAGSNLNSKFFRKNGADCWFAPTHADWSNPQSRSHINFKYAPSKQNMKSMWGPSNLNLSLWIQTCQASSSLDVVTRKSTLVRFGLRGVHGEVLTCCFGIFLIRRATRLRYATLAALQGDVPTSMLIIGNQKVFTQRIWMNMDNY